MVELPKKGDIFWDKGAKYSVAGTDIPIIFAPVIDPVGVGIVESRRQPGDNLTGIQSGSTIPKSLEWLLNQGRH